MMRLLSTTVLAVLTAHAAFAAGANATPSWQAYANCAAAYRANWQDRLADPNRPREMSNMIQTQSQDYEKVAVRHYATEKKSSQQVAQPSVHQYIKDSVTRFIAMDRAKSLETFIDQCPQLDSQDK